MSENKELLEEARACMVNAICAYGQAFELLDEEEITPELLTSVAEFLEEAEAIMPVVISMYEMTKKLSGNPDLTFVDWIREMNDSGALDKFLK